MNVYAVVILAALLVQYGLEVAARLLNLRALRPELPAEFEDTYDPQEYRRSQTYTRTRTRFGLLTDTFNLALLIAFWFSGGFAWLDELVRGWGFGPIVTGLLFIGLLGLAKSALSLPFSLYSTFVLEERFGFNKTTPRVFALDLLKSLALSLVIGVPLLAAILWFFGETGPYGWLYAWGMVTAFMLLMQHLAPRFIMPLFNDFEPLDDEELRSKILSYADAVDFSVEDVFVMDGSRRSAKANAFFAGLGSNRRVVLFDTLVDQHDGDELLTIVAHEVGHYKKQHIPQRMVISVLHTGVLFLLLSFFLQVEGLYEAFYVDQMAVYTGLLFFGLLYTPVDLLLSVPMQMLSRRHEYQADRFAVRTTRRAEAFIRGLKKLAANNLANLTPHPFYVALNYSHPPLLARLKAIRTAETPEVPPADPATEGHPAVLRPAPEQ